MYLIRVSQCSDLQNLPEIFNVQVETASPNKLTALQVYIAESSGLKLLMDKDTNPKSKVLRILDPTSINKLEFYSIKEH